MQEEIINLSIFSKTVLYVKQKMLSSRNFSTLQVEINSENFDMLQKSADE
jgi:hypothetical protein